MPSRTRMKRKKKRNRTRKKGGTGVTNLTKINTINGRDIYRFTLNGCDHFVNNWLNKSYVYINTEVPTILKLKETAKDLTDEDIARITSIIGTEDDIPKLRRLDVYTHKLNPECFQSLNLNLAQETIDELNRVIQVKCKGLTLTLDYVYDIKPPQGRLTFMVPTNPTDLYLCLNNSVGCISSINLDYDSDSITINSSTSDECQRKNYNKLLRCVVMIIAPLLSANFKTIKSFAVNTISAYSLIRYFDGFIPMTEVNAPYYEFLRENGLETDGNELIKVQRYSDASNDRFKLDVHCEINDVIATKNKDAFVEYVESTKCECDYTE